MKSTDLKLPGANDFFTQEAYKVLRTNLQFCGPDVHVVALTSSGENEGKTTVTLGLAKSLAELGKRVLVIDADMRKSVMAGRNTTAQNAAGLSEILTGFAKVHEVLYSTNGGYPHILFAGQYPPNPVELLSGRYFNALLERSRDAYDYVLIDTPPLGSVIDAAVIAPKCDGTLLVIGGNNVRYRKAQDVVAQLEKAGSKILGVVRNNAPRKKADKYYGYGYGYGA